VRDIIPGSEQPQGPLQDASPGEVDQ
jgi:hypothetical protein